MSNNLLPYYDERQTDINMLMFHCSAQNTSNMINVLNSLHLSCHYIIDTDGSITQVVEEHKRAWHAGLGSWRDIKSDLNSHSIGIELSHHSLGQDNYPHQQINSLIQLSQELIKRYSIKPQYIVGHSDTAPTRKPDPGMCFPWQELANAGIGLWYDIKNANKIKNNDILQLLSSIGYSTNTTEEQQASIYAFARHFLPELSNKEDNLQHLVDNVFALFRCHTCGERQVCQITR